MPPLRTLLAAAALLPSCSLAWIPPSASTRSQQRRTTNIYAYLDDGSSPVNGNSRKSRVANEQQAEDYTGAGTLGDIMSRESADFTGLVTTDGGLLHQKFGIQSPLDRMALTANGNLQRLFSSYYDAPVHVVVDRCDQSTEKTWDRVVHLTVFGETFCTATSHITVHDADCIKLVESGTVGLGQLFRHLDKLPSFSLLQAGYCEQNGGMWRIYELECAELCCHIEEKFLPEMWNIQPQIENEER